MDLDNFFNPKRVAVIGASGTSGKVGNSIFFNLLKSKANVYPVNPKHKSIKGNKCYPSVSAISEKIDLAVVVTPAPTVPGIVRECGASGIKHLIIISAGFAETGNIALDEELKKAISETGVRVIGPNCLGVIDVNTNFNCSFYSGPLPKGTIGGFSLLSQSGALGVAILDFCSAIDAQLSKFVSVGNSINITFSDFVDYFQKDDSTQSICIYAEDIKEARKFFDSAQKSNRDIYILKAGRSASGAKAASTHTAALAAPDKIYEGAFRQFGVKRVDTIKQLISAGQLNSMGDVPSGRRALVVTNAGGPGVLAADAAEKYGVEIVKIPDDVLAEIDKEIGTKWSRSNPADIVGDAAPERYKVVLDAVDGKEFYDIIFLILTPQSMSAPEEVAKIFSEFSKRNKVRHIQCYSCFMGGELVSKAKDILRRHSIVNFEEPEEGFALISRMV